jgi:protein-tyrosine phosphatase
VPPFTVLHVCMGNICRSPMAERLTVVAARKVAGELAGKLLLVHSVGTGGWHIGKPMDSSAARQVLSRGGEVDMFRARKLLAEHLDSSDLILTATAEQRHVVQSMRPDAQERTFVLGEFGRLMRLVDPSTLPPFAPTPDAVYDRGVALVSAVAAQREGRTASFADDLDDPWGRGDAYFGRIADEIGQTVVPLAAVLLDGADPPGAP